MGEFMDKWEYKTLKFKTKGFWGGVMDLEDFEYALNQMGDDGWELVSCFDTSQSQGSSREVIAVFKKQKSL